MRAATFFVSAFAAVAFAQDESSAASSEAPSSSIDAFPQTSYLQQTNSLGVVTGMPAAASSQPSQPAADTSIPAQPLPVTSLPAGVSIPAQASGIHTVVIPLGNNSTTQVVVSANNSTTVIYQANTATDASATGTGSRRPTATKSDGSAETGSATGSGATGSSSETPGAAANLQVAASFLGAGLLAAFL